MTATLTDNLLTDLRRRRAAGESVKALAQEVGLVWQKLDKAIRNGLPRLQDGPPTDGAVLPTLTPGEGAGPLTERYRPRTLAALWGQPAAVKYLRRFVQNPHPIALIFEGETGTGKTSAALALAAELGCVPDQHEFGGVHVVAAGEQTADTIRERFGQLWHTPFVGSGWKVLIVNEADRMSPAVETIWLDRLENLPPKSVVIFTTNYPDKLSTRLRDRCVRLGFEGDAAKLTRSARDLLAAMWRAETGRQPDCRVLDQITAAAVQDGKLSFRRAVQLLHAHLMEREDQ